uniref:Uncharacterized protein n=1 Tax=Leersia perrieri TaxID=77586 RepID=A0A0D9XZT5_9ORYZ
MGLRRGSEPCHAMFCRQHFLFSPKSNHPPCPQSSHLSAGDDMVVIDLFVNAAMPTCLSIRIGDIGVLMQPMLDRRQTTMSRLWSSLAPLAVVASSTCSLSITNVYMRALDNIIEWLYAAAGECQAACQTLLYLFLNQKGRKTLFQKREERNEVRTHNQTHKPELQPVGSAEERY